MGRLRGGARTPPATDSEQANPGHQPSRSTGRGRDDRVVAGELELEPVGGDERHDAPTVGGERQVGRGAAARAAGREASRGLGVAVGAGERTKVFTKRRPQRRRETVEARTPRGPVRPRRGEPAHDERQRVTLEAAFETTWATPGGSAAEETIRFGIRIDLHQAERPVDCSARAGTISWRTSSRRYRRPSVASCSEPSESPGRDTGGWLPRRVRRRGSIRSPSTGRTSDTSRDSRHLHRAMLP